MNFLNDISNLTLTQILVFGSVLAGGFYFTFYNKGDGLKGQIENEHIEFQKAEAALKQQKNELVKLKQFEADLKKDERSVNVFLDYISEQMTSIEMSHFIEREAGVAGVNVTQKQHMRESRDGDKDFYTLKAKLKIVGSFQQIVFFLSKLTAQKRILSVTSININSNPADQYVTADMSVSAFRYKPPEKKKDEEEQGG